MIQNCSLAPAELAASDDVACSHRLPVQRFQHGITVQAMDHVAEEIPTALVYNGISHAVLLATPTDLEDFAIGFSLSEGIIERRSEVFGIDIVPRDNGIEVQLRIAGDRMFMLKERRRSLAGRTGCGLCGTESLDAVLRPNTQLEYNNTAISPEAIQHAFRELAQRQVLHKLTGAVHGAGLANRAGEIVMVREDVGRHNALDKLIGAALKSEIEPRDHFIVVTSRASYEMVQKAVTFGIPLLAAISAPTALAVNMARQSGLCLIGFARGEEYVVYT